MRPERVQNPPDEPCGEGKYELEMPPLPLVVPRHEKRLIAPLRKAAQTRDPDEILVRAVCVAYRAPPGDEDATRLAHATADLAVTGGAAAELFARGGTTWGDLASMAAARLPGVDAGDTRLRGHAAALLERAQRVSVLLRKSDADRKTYRLSFPELKGWIGVSGEDDAPHRPVNVPQSPFPTHYATVPVDGEPYRTRYVWSGPDDAPLIVLLHGHSSRVEEYDELVRALGELRHPDGRRKWAIAVPDLPSCGYTTRVDPDEVEGNGKWPLLDFLERFIEAFVDTICAERGRPARLAAVAGGSLGGNLTLRLAEARVPWARSFAAWSAASVWTSMEGDLIKGCALRTTRERMTDDEVESSRHDYFQQVFVDAICGTGRPQPKMWYRDHWPCAARHTNRAIWDRREIYGPEFRRFHWQVAHEQLVFSHVQMTDGRAPWQRIRGPVFLAAGDQDNYMWTHIHDRTADLARHLEAAGVSGRCRLFEDTGHSIQDERPALLARELDAFLDEI